MPWLVGVVALVAAVGLASVIAALLALRHQLRGRRPVAGGSLRRLLDELRHRAGVRRSVPLTVASRVSVPMAVGVVRPEIVVPPMAAAGTIADTAMPNPATAARHFLRSMTPPRGERVSNA